MPVPRLSNASPQTIKCQSLDYQIHVWSDIKIQLTLLARKEQHDKDVLVPVNWVEGSPLRLVEYEWVWTG